LGYNISNCILVRNYRQVKEGNEDITKFTTEVIENINQLLEAGKSKRSIAKDVKVPESNLRKRLRMETVPT
jgi:hypothetical protein